MNSEETDDLQTVDCPYCTSTLSGEQVISSHHRVDFDSRVQGPKVQVIEKRELLFDFGFVTAISYSRILAI